MKGYRARLHLFPSWAAPSHWPAGIATSGVQQEGWKKIREQKHKPLLKVNNGRFPSRRDETCLSSYPLKGLLGASPLLPLSPPRCVSGPESPAGQALPCFFKALHSANYTSDDSLHQSLGDIFPCIEFLDLFGAKELNSSSPKVFCLLSKPRPRPASQAQTALT